MDDVSGVMLTVLAAAGYFVAIQATHTTLKALRIGPVDGRRAAASAIVMGAWAFVFAVVFTLRVVG